MHAVVSLDGFIADDRDEVGPLFDWYFNGDRPLFEGDDDASHPEGWHPEADVPFVEDVTEAIRIARERAGDGVVALSAGEAAGHALALGLVDVVAMDVVPVVFGSGKRFFGSIEGQHLLGDPDIVVQGERVLHLRYPVT
jgi:hypothetical protein